jgi:glutaredoxin-related protein
MLLYSKDNISKGSIEDYGIEDLTIETALKLMGFQFNSENIEIGKSDERDFYKKFYSEYVKNRELREWLIILNKSYPKLRDKNKNENEESYKKLKDKYPNKKKEFEEIKKSAKDKIRAILSNLDQELLEEKLNRSQAFGYILEELTFYKLEKLLEPLIKKKKVTLVHSLKIKNEKINDVTVAEFDIALLANNGKFIMFECKSGGMTGDTAKARNYATYAVSGVYGLPILITPIISDEADKEVKDKILQDDYYDIYKNIKTAIASAERAGLDVWYLDNMDSEENLKKYIEL